MSSFPGALPDIVVHAVLHTALIEIIRGIVFHGGAISAYGLQLLIGGGWLIFPFAAAVLL